MYLSAEHAGSPTESLQQVFFLFQLAELARPELFNNWYNYYDEEEMMSLMIFLITMTVLRYYSSYQWGWLGNILRHNMMIVSRLELHWYCISDVRVTLVTLCGTVEAIKSDHCDVGMWNLKSDRSVICKKLSGHMRCLQATHNLESLIKCGSVWLIWHNLFLHLIFFSLQVWSNLT